MNKDDMSDDAEFDAFLNGESDLARRLQAMAQPAPSAALDAAILANARAAMAQEARPAAANDSGGNTAAPRLAPSLGWRWRMPAGIAAAVLVGVFAKQSFEASSDLNQVALPAPAPVMSEAAPAPQAVTMQPEAAPVAADATAPAELQRQAAPPAEFKVPAKVQREAKPAPMKPAPAPVAVHESPAPAPPAAPVVVQAPKSAPPVMADKASKSIDFEAYSAEKRAPAAFNYNAPPMPAPAPAPVAEAAAAPMDRVEIRAAPSRNRDSSNVSGAFSARASAQRQSLAEPPPAGVMAESAWLDRIEKLLAQGRQAEAVADWKAFREVYPNYPVPEATREKLE